MRELFSNKFLSNVYENEFINEHNMCNGVRVFNNRYSNYDLINHTFKNTEQISSKDEFRNICIENLNYMKCIELPKINLYSNNIIWFIFMFKYIYNFCIQ